MADPFVVSHVRRLPLFAHLSPDQVGAIAAAFQQARYAPGDRLYRQGELSQALYLFISGGGRVLYTGPDGIEREQGELQPGAHVGEEALFVGGRHDSSVVITQDSIVLILTKSSFDAVLRARPDIRSVLSIPKDLVNTVQAQQQRGIRSDEMTLLLTRRHPWAFAGHALRGVILFALLVGLALVTTRLSPPIPPLTLMILGLAVLLPVLLIVYYFFEWRNDYFIITSQRVIHEEHYLLTGEERRDQALLSSVQNVNVSRRGAIAEVIGFGDVVVNTAGNQRSVVLDMVPDPVRVQQLIFQQVQRRKEQETAQGQNVIRSQVEAMLSGSGGNTVGTPVAPYSPYVSYPQSSQSINPLVRIFRAILPPMRLVEGDRVTYRKHWIVLIGNVWKPMLFFALFLVLVAVRWSGRLPFVQDIPGLVFWGAGLVWMALSAFWLYWEYIDWREDLYILDSQSVIDIKRRPLWLRETRIQAGLQQIQNVTSEIRSFWGQLLQFGTVIIQTAAEHGMMRFSAVHKPTEIAEEILQRVEHYGEIQANASQEEQHRVVSQYLSAYHQATRNDNIASSVPPAAAPTMPVPSAPPPNPPKPDSTQPMRPLWRGGTNRSQPVPPPTTGRYPASPTMPGQLPEMPPDLDQTQPRTSNSDTQPIDPPKRT